jgi:hypothetical protein
MPTLAEAIISRLQFTLGNTGVSKIAAAIVEELSTISPEQTGYLSYTTLSSIAHTRSDDPELLGAIAALTSSTPHVLEVFFVYIIDDNKETALTAEEFSVAKRQGFVINPWSGEPDENFAEHVYPYFKTSGEFAAAQEDRA